MTRTEPMVQELRAKYRANPNDSIAAWRLAWRLVEDAKKADSTSGQGLLLEARSILTSMRSQRPLERLPHVEAKLQEVSGLERKIEQAARRAAAELRVEQALADLRTAAGSAGVNPAGVDEAIDHAIEAISREGSAYREQYLDALLARAEYRAARDFHAVNDDVISVLGSKEALSSRDLGQRALGLARVALAQNQSPPLTTAVAQHFDARLRAAGTLDQLRQLADDVEEQIRATPGEPVFRACRVEVLTAQMARIDGATEAGLALGSGIAQAIEGLRSLAPARPLSSERLAQLSQVASRLPDIEPLRIEKERLHFFCVRSLEDRTTAPARDHNVRHLWLRALQRLALHQQATNHPDAPETLELCEAPA